MLKTNKNLKKAAMILAVCATVFTVPTPVSAAKPSTATVKRAYEKLQIWPGRKPYKN